MTADCPLARCEHRRARRCPVTTQGLASPDVFSGLHQNLRVAGQSTEATICLIEPRNMGASPAAQSLVWGRGISLKQFSSKCRFSWNVTDSGLHLWLLSVQFSRSVVSDSLQPHGLQHTRPSCPSPTPGVYSNSCPLSRRCHPTISSSVIPFSSCHQSFPASGSFPMSQLFA